MKSKDQQSLEEAYRQVQETSKAEQTISSQTDTQSSTSENTSSEGQ